MAKKLISYDDTKPGTGLPQVVEARIDGRYATKAELDSAVAGAGGVTSPSVSRIIASSDPDTPLQAGDLLLVYEEERYTYDLSVNGLSLLTPTYETSPRWSSEEGYVEHLGGQPLLRTGMTFSDLGGRNFRDVEVLGLVSSPAYTAGLASSLVVRGSGEAANANMIRLSLSQAGLAIGVYRNGTTATYGTHTFSPVPDEWMWMRLRVEGNNFMGKCWKDGETEPAGWQLEYALTSSDADLMPTGWVGILSATSATSRWAKVAVGVDGGTAVAS